MKVRKYKLICDYLSDPMYEAELHFWMPYVFLKFAFLFQKRESLVHIFCEELKLIVLTVCNCICEKLLMCYLIRKKQPRNPILLKVSGET
jgi:hypothetical protein